jgi:AAA domain
MARQQQHIIRVTAEQFKNVRVIDFAPNRFVTKISGANGAGKSSALDAVFNALAPRKTVPPELVRRGEQTGKIRIETNTHIITRHLDSKGGSLEIEVKGAQTLIKEPVDWLKSITGEVGFDPLEFMRMHPDEQFSVLKSLVPLETNVDALEEQNERDDATITMRKAEMKRLAAQRDGITVDPTLPTEWVDVTALLAEATAIEQHNLRVSEELHQRERVERQQSTLDAEGEWIEKRQNELRAELKKLEQALDVNHHEQAKLNALIDSWEPLPERKDRSAIDEQISGASAKNADIASNNANRERRDKMQVEGQAMEAELAQLAESIRDRRLRIARAMEKAKFPVPGLSFETREENSAGRERKKPKKVVTYKGIPLAEASTGEQIRVSAAIGMAGKPDLRFLLIREGSLLDDDGMAILEQMAHENDYQILIETVDTSGKVGIFMQDGEVAAINKDDAPAKPAKKRTKKETVN